MKGTADSQGSELPRALESFNCVVLGGSRQSTTSLYSILS